MHRFSSGDLNLLDCFVLRSVLELANTEVVSDLEQDSELTSEIDDQAAP